MSRDESRVGEGVVERHIFELSLFLITAARGCVGEPKLYGPVRLVDAISRLTDVYSETSGLKQDQFLLDVKKEIDTKKYLVMASERDFVVFLDELVLKFTEEMKRRYG